MKRFFKSKGSNVSQRQQSPAPPLGTWGRSSSGGGNRRSRSLGHSKSEKLLSSLMGGMALGGSGSGGGGGGGGGARQASVRGLRRTNKELPPPLTKLSRCESDLLPDAKELSPRKKNGKRTPRELAKRSGVKSAQRRKHSGGGRQEQLELELQKEGPLRLRYVTTTGEGAMQFSLFWCSYRHPCLFRFVNEEVWN